MFDQLFFRSDALTRQLSAPVIRQNSARTQVSAVTMLQTCRHVIHFKRILDFGEGQVGLILPRSSSGCSSSATYEWTSARCWVWEPDKCTASSVI
jgi:hypothetical protein